MLVDNMEYEDDEDQEEEADEEEDDDGEEDTDNEVEDVYVDEDEDEDEDDNINWKVTPASYRKMWFEEYARKYKWLAEYEDNVKQIWNAKCSDILRGTKQRIMQDVFHKQFRPKWIPHEVMNELERLWTSPEYLSKCEIAKTN
ncbi:hypothetical protein K1719_014868 [Acacia pycnantha]|nr:hypothetical protein K1719_014868 [Acacia pycnantha]